ncbi:MAG: hypothetical protein COA58_14560 [Bacteroidetes bacterium]|nr:MAG: hypothetical protein COA58_14560 [Bacteroidota bacterium]
MNKYLLTLFLAVVLVSCADEKTNFTHHINNSETINSAELIYQMGDSTVLKGDITQQDLTILRQETSVYNVTVAESNQSSTFTNIPAKYIHLDANVEVSRNVFHSYFPAEWKEMKGVNYTSIKITNSEDPAIFYVAVVHTGTKKEIAKHSEDY